MTSQAKSKTGKGDAIQDARLQFYMENLDLGLWEYETQQDAFLVSNAWRRIRGLGPDEDHDAADQAWLRHLHPEDRQSLHDDFEALVRGDISNMNINYRYRHTQGHWVWIWCQARVMEYQKDGKPARIVGIDTDISAVKTNEEERLRIANKLQLAVEASGMGVWEFDPATATVHWDDRLLEIYGFPTGENDRSGDLWATYIHPDDADATQAYADHCEEHKLDFKRDFRILRQDGEVRHIRSLARFIASPQTEGRLIGVNIDVTEDYERATELEQIRRQLEYDSRHDALTGLANRRLLDETTQHLFDNMADCDSCAVMHLDLDHFKQINDTLGHAVGDAVLVTIAKRLTEIVGELGLVSRVGGDEFVILLDPAPSSEQMVALCDRIISRGREPIDYEGHSCLVGVSIGIASTMGPPAKPAQIFIDADAALYAAKDDGRSCFRVFNAEVKSRSKQEANARQELLDALANDEIICHYQPQYDARTLRVIGAEALVRWHSPTRGVLTPDQFLPLAQKTGLVQLIDQHVFRHVLAQQTDWVAKGVNFPRIALNVSLARLMDDGLLDEVKATLTDDHKISFELLETAFLDDPGTLASHHMRALRGMGIGLELDDFGSGHSSIVALQAIRPDRVKIDQRLVNPINVNPNQLLLLQSLTKIARLSGSQVVVEGLETGIHLAAIRNVDCDALQGYALTYPMPADDFVALLEAGPEKLAK